MKYPASDKYQTKHRLNGLCTACPAKAVEGKTRCERCLVVQRETMKRLREKRKGVSIDG